AGDRSAILGAPPPRGREVLRGTRAAIEQRGPGAARSGPRPDVPDRDRLAPSARRRRIRYRASAPRRGAAVAGRRRAGLGRLLPRRARVPRPPAHLPLRAAALLGRARSPGRQANGPGGMVLPPFLEADRRRGARRPPVRVVARVRQWLRAVLVA